jgi:molybdate transport system substrate-binding protein
MSTRPRGAHRHPHLTALAAAAMVAVAATSCSSSSASSGTTTTQPTLTGSITVSAASSLTGTFGQIGTQFQSAHPGTTVKFNFGSSGALVTQIQQGAPADVFASASTKDMTTAQTSGDIVGKPVIFARNTLKIVVKPGNPLGIASLADLNKATVVALCTPSAPCGAAAATVLQQAGITLPTSKVTLGTDAKSTLQQVTSGGADAAIVYVTDAKTVGATGTGVPIPASRNFITSYPIALVKGTANAALGTAWIAYVVGPKGQKVLRAAGFLPPG